MDDVIEAESSFDFRELLEALRRSWWMLATGTVLGLLAAAMINQFSTPMYQSTARVYISFAGERAAGSDLRVATTIAGRLNDYSALSSTPVVIKPASEELSAVSGEEVTLGELNKAITVRPQGRDTNFLNVRALTPDPEQSAQWANSTAAVVVRAIQAVETPNNSTESLVRATIAQPASPSSAPATPKKNRNLLYGGLLGLALGAGAALLRTRLDRTVKDPETLDRLSGEPVIGLVPFDTEAKEHPLIPSGKSAMRSEAFRKLRTNLQYVNVDNPPRVISVVSASPSEGKSTTAANLALTMALAGQTVVLVETDLRRPRLAEYLGLEGDVGLTDVLAGKLNWREAIMPWNRGLFSVLAQGEQAPNPTEILGSRHMHDLLNELRENFDYVIMDTSPVSLVSDATVVASQADGVVLVVRSGKTTRDMVTGTVNALHQVNAHLLGSVLTFMPVSRGGYGYSYGYGYGYGYGSKSGYTTRGMVYESSDDVAETTTTDPRENSRNESSSGQESSWGNGATSVEDSESMSVDSDETTRSSK